MREKNEKLWAHLLKELNDFEILAGWFENTRYDSDTTIAGIAAVQNFGAFISQNVTDKQRKFLHACGIHLKKSTTKLNIAIPPRPFMDNAKKRIQGAEGKEILLQEVLRVFEGRQTMKQAAIRLKEWLKNVIQEEIVKMQEPPLAQSTVRNREKRYTSKARNQDPKTTAKPLVDTGLMLETVQGKYEIK